MTPAETERALADAAALGMSLEALLTVASEWGCSVAVAGALLRERRQRERPAMAARPKAPELTLEESAKKLNYTVDVLEQIAVDWGCTAEDAAELLLDQVEQCERERPAPMPRKRGALTTSERVLVDAQLVAERAARGELDDRQVAEMVASNNMLPKWMRPGVAGRPAFTSYRSMVVRRVGDMPHPPLWFYRFGAVPMQVRAWVLAGAKSESPRERFVTHALRALRNRVGWRRMFPLAAIAHLLYFDARKLEEKQKGYWGAVEGVRRSDIARRSAHYFCGAPLHEDTISRYLTQLVELLGGVLERRQPAGSQAVAKRLHKSRHYLADGSVRVWSTNIYLWRDDAWVIRSGLDPANADKYKERAKPAESIGIRGTPISIDGSITSVDLKAGYQDKHTDQANCLVRGAVGGSVSPAATSIRPPAAASMRVARARGDPAVPRPPDDDDAGY